MATTHHCCSAHAARWPTTGERGGEREGVLIVKTQTLINLV